jgi:DNA-binding beta-propeller fold protein YncE
MSNPFLTCAALTVGLVMLTGAAKSADSAGSSPLELEAKVALGNVRGRIDHMAVDLKRRRLFVAELGNDTVGIVDLAERDMDRTLEGLNEPQGVGFDPSTDTLFVANARDGSVKLFEGNTYAAKGQIELGNDADNIRIDAAGRRVVVGYGNGGLAILDPSTRDKIQNVPLKAHPESFQIDPDTGRIFVNLPDAHAIAVVDGRSGKQIANWTMNKAANFAMAVDRDRSRILVAFRSPPEIAAFSMTDGKPVSTAETCGDVDDLFVDAKRARIYVSCGSGFIDVLDANGAPYRRVVRVPTAAGARTSLFVPEMDRFLVAVRAGQGEPASIWIFRPMP